MLERLTWRESACPALLRSLTFVGAAVAILLSYRTLDLPNEGWAVISVALVMQIQARASFRVAAIRVVVNVVSATVALLALHLGGATIPSFVIALLLVGLFCQLANLDDGLRAAYICVVIIISPRPHCCRGYKRAPAMRRFAFTHGFDQAGFLVAQSTLQ
jgi:uncharacterized membrane protein YccC